MAERANIGTSLRATGQNGDKQPKRRSGQKALWIDSIVLIARVEFVHAVRVICR